MNPARFSVRQPILVNLLALVIVLAGGVATDSMSREAYPTVSTGWARITTVFPGAGPEDVERLVTVPIEDAVAELDGVARVVSFSSEGISFIGVELQAGLDDVTPVVSSIASEVQSLRDLPPGAEASVVREEMVRIPTLSVALRGEVQESVLQTAGRQLHRRLLRVRGVGEVEASGLSTRQLRVEVDPARLRAARMGLPEIAQGVRTRAEDLAAGTVDDGERTRVVRGMIRAETARELGDVVIRPDPLGAAVRLRHVADVSDAYDPSGVVARVDGERAILFDLHRQGRSDVVEVNERIRAAVAAHEASLPDDLSLVVFNDASHEVARTTEVLYENALLGLLLVFATLGIFMGARNALMAALGLPVALAGGVFVLHLMDVTINMLSLGAMILCVGLVVDDAIVLIENIYRHMEEGKSRVDAAIDGAREVMWPVISATGTTCAAFLPLLIMSGVLGEFFAIIPKVVVAVLVASLVEALFILPSHMADFGGRRAPAPGDRLAGLRRFAQAATLRYERALRACLRWRKTTLMVAYLLFGGLLAATLLAKDVVLLTDGDVDAFEVRIQMPADSSVEATGAVVQEVERRLVAMRTDDVEAIWATRGRSRNELRPIEEPYVGMVTVSLVPLERRSSNHAGRDLLDEASDAFDDLVGPEQVQVLEHEFGPPVGAPVQVRIAGDDPARLASIAMEVADELQRVPGVRNVENSESGHKRELRVEVDEGRAALHGLTAAQVGRWLRLAFSEAPLATALVSNERVDIILSLAADAHNPEEIAELTLRTPSGGEVSLGDIATIEEERRANHIRRNDRRRGVRVSAQIDRTTTSQAANRRVRELIAPLVDANPDVSITLAGEYRETNDSVRSLFLAFLLAIAIIYSILAAQFRSLLHPFVVIGAIPLSLIGVAVGFFVSGAAVGLIALIGVVGLAGIVVNDSLVLVDFIAGRRAEGLEIDEAIVVACKQRMRPIVATSVTTIVGILPLALSGADAPLLSPMATAIAWGLSAATVLTLIVVPCAYRISAELGETLARLFGPTWRRVRGAED